MNEQLPSESQPAKSATTSKRSIRWLVPVLLLAVPIVGGVWYAMHLAAGRAEVAAKDAIQKAFPQTEDNPGVLLRVHEGHVASIDLRRQRTDESTVKDVSKLIHLTHLNLSDCGLTDRMLTSLGRLPKLLNLTLAENEIGDEGIVAASRMPSLKALYIRHTNLGDEGLKVIGRIKTLENLDISNTKVSNDGMKYLAGLKNLVRIDMEEAQVTDEGIMNLAPLKNLRYINAIGSQLTSDGLSSLADEIPGLTFILQ